MRAAASRGRRMPSDRDPAEDARRGRADDVARVGLGVALAQVRRQVAKAARK